MSLRKLHLSSFLVVVGSTLAAFLAPACGGDDGTAGVDQTNDAGASDGASSDGNAAVDGRLADGALVDAPANDAPASETSIDAGPCTKQAPTVPGLKIVDVTTSTIPSGIFATQPPNSDDWYVVDQNGRVRIIRAGTLLATPFLDVSAGMGTSLGERGLLSIAFHPNYASNGRFFVMGTPADNGDGSFSPANADAIVEFKRDPANADVALATKVRDIVVLPSSAANHNGGTIVFGPDGFLYAGTGDGGGGCESSKPGAVQDTTQLFGKILRLDVDASSPFAAAGNPFADDKRVYHYGLRNPFRFNFDAVTGDLFIGDVGQNQFEEISVAPGNAAAKNFGWPAYEGATAGTCGTKPLGGPSAYTAPIVSIDRNGSGPFADYTSIIGGRVYRGAAIPALQGVYLFSDFTGADIGALRYCDGQAYGPVAVAKSQIATPTGTLGTVSSFVAGHDGELYVTYGYGGARLGKFVLK